MSIAVLQTARSGSKSVLNKNIEMISGKPLFRHPLDKSLESNLIDHWFVSTDCPTIKQNITSLQDNRVNIINRPEYLSQDTSPHHDVMIHAIEEIESKIKNKLNIVVILLGNSLGSSADSLDWCIRKMNQNQSIDSIQSVCKFNMFNPYRAFSVDEKTGLLNNVVRLPNVANSNDKNFAGDMFFFNGSFWICRRDIITGKKGLNPFPWLGFNILPYVEETKMEVDAPWQMEFVKKVEEKC